MKLVLVTLALAAAPAVAFAPHVPESDEPTVSPTSYPTVKPTIKEVECVDAGCAEQCTNQISYRAQARRRGGALFLTGARRRQEP